jgi:hypothetical protein
VAKFKIEAKNLRKIAEQIERRKVPAEKALEATVRDMRSRVPGFVAGEVTGVYNIKKSEVMPAKINKKTGKLGKTAGTVRVIGKTVTGLEVVYTGRLLTPTHFGMRPKKLAKTKRGRRAPITAEIKKGQRKQLHPDAFLGSNKGGGYIPFRRHTNKAYPIYAIKTLSMPQMVQNEIVYKKISNKVNSELEKRLAHNVKRFLDK